MACASFSHSAKSFCTLGLNHKQISTPNLRPFSTIGFNLEKEKEEMEADAYNPFAPNPQQQGASQQKGGEVDEE